MMHRPCSVLGDRVAQQVAETETLYNVSYAKMTDLAICSESKPAYVATMNRSPRPAQNSDAAAWS